MSRKIARKFAAAVFASLIIGIATLARPAEAVFSSDSAYSVLRDQKNRLFTPLFDGTNCYFSDNVSNFTDRWMLLSNMYYYGDSTDGVSSQGRVAFGILLNTRTQEIWDGGFCCTWSASSALARTIPPC